MAVNAKVGADFTDFERGLKGMEKQVKSSADAISSIFGVSLSLAAVTAYIGGIMQLGDEIQKLADKTGMSAEETQKLGFIAKQSGLDMSAMAMAAQNLQQRLGDRDEGAVGAMGRLGIKAEAFIALGTYQQMQQLAGAIGGVTDPTTRASIAADLFGKSWKEIMPALISDFEKLASEAPVMSNATVKTLDDAGDAWDKLKTTVQVNTAEAYSSAVGFIERVAIASDTHRTQLDRLGALMFGLRGPQDWGALPLPASPLSAGATGAGFNQKDVDAATKSLNKTLEDQIAIRKSLDDAAKKEAERFEQTYAMLQARIKTEEIFSKAINDPARELAAQAMGRLIEKYDLYNDTLRAATASQHDMNDSLWESLPPLEKIFKTVNRDGVTIREGATDWKKWGNVAVSALNETSRAAEMAGNKTMAALMSIGSAVAQGAMQGGLWGAIGSGALAAFGAVSGALFKTEGRKTNDLRDAFIAAQGGLAALNEKAHQAGMTLDALLSASKVDAYTSAEKRLTEALGAQNKKLEDQATLQQKIADTQLQIESARQASIPTWQTISGIMDKYGINVELAGRAAQQMMVTSASTGLLNEAQQWAAAGLDTGVFAGAASGAFSTLAQQALAFGSALPANMRPMIESLIAQGQLMDKTGRAITDIAAFTFGEAVQTEQERLVAAFDTLTLALQDLTTQLAVLTGVPPTVNAATRGGSGLYESGGFTGRGVTNITIQAMDSQSLDNWLRAGGARALTNSIDLMTG